MMMILMKMTTILRKSRLPNNLRTKQASTSRRMMFIKTMEMTMRAKMKAMVLGRKQGVKLKLVPIHLNLKAQLTLRVWHRNVIIKAKTMSMMMKRRKNMSSLR